MNNQDLLKIKELANEFRNAIDSLDEHGAFDDDLAFWQFPKGCCGDSADLFGQYLLDEGINTWYVCGTHYESYEDE